MAYGPIGGGEFGWQGGSGSGGGGGGTGNASQYSGVVGQPDGPIDGQSTWIPGGLGSEILIGATEVWTLQNAKQNLTSLGAAPDFTFNDITGEIDISPNIWVNGDAVNGWYKPAAT